MGMRASYGGRVGLLLVLIAAGFLGLALQGARSSADDGSRPAASVTRPEVDSLLKGAEPVASLDTNTSKTYRRRDGSFVTRVFAQSSDADPTLTPADGGGWTADGHGGTERFPASLADPIKVTRGSAWVSMSLTGGAGAGTVKGSTVTYADALPGVAVSYQASDGAVGEDLHLTDADAPSSYTFDVAASEGVHPVTQRNGTIALLDSADQRIFSLSPSYAFADGHPTDTQKVTTALAATSSGWRVTLSLDEVWLRGALADGPVTIDPTVELQGATKDCALTSDTPALSYCSDHGLWVGWSGDHDHRSVIKWDVSAIPQDALILAGDAGVYQSHSMVTVDKTLALHRVTRDWTNGASWNTYDGTHAWTTPGGDYDPSPVATQVDPAWNDGWVDWYPTGLVQHWVDGSLPNYGVLIKDDGTHTTGEEDFGATEAGDPVTAPELDIVWTTRGGTPDASTFESRSIDAKTNAAVNAANGNLVLATKDVAVAGQGGLDLDFNHYYNSIADPTIIGGVGLQTTASLGRDVHLAHLYGPDIAFSRGDGLTVAFANPHTSGTTKTFDTPYELASATLTQNTSTNTYTLDLPSGLPAWGGMHQVLTFDPSGAWTTVADTQGHHLSLSYYPSGYTDPPSLGGITDTNNGYYDVDRSGSGLESVDNIADLTDTRQWRFTYDTSGALTRATSVDNTRYQYTYDSIHRLTRVTTPAGVVWLITYNGTTRQVASIVQTTDTAHTTGPTTTFTYSSPTSPCQSTNFDYKKTVVHRPDNSTTTYCANDHAQITYDTDNPTASPSGEWHDLAGGVVNGRGQRSITLSGTDAGAGVKTMALEEVGGATLASTTLPCDPRNATNPTACPHTSTAVATFDPVVLTEGVHTFRQRTTDYAGNAGYSPTWTVEVRLERVVHATVYNDDTATDPVPVSEDWAQLGTLIGRSVEDSTIATRDDVACPTGSCAELRQRELGGSGVPADTDSYVRYRGTSTSDNRIGVASDMVQLGLAALGDAPTSTGTTSNVVFAWQVLPPGAGTTYEVYETYDVIDDGGTATDGPSGEQDTPVQRTVRSRLVLDAATKLPIRQTSFAADNNELLSRRIWTYDATMLYRRDLPADTFGVARPANPQFEKAVEYADPAATTLAARNDAANGERYQPATLEAPLRLAESGQLCAASRRNVFHMERPTASEVPADDGKPASTFSATRTVTTFVKRSASGRCSRSDRPVLSIESAPAGSPLAEAWEDGYEDLGATLKPSARASAEVEVEVAGKNESVPVLDIDGKRRGAYLERGGTALIIAGQYEPGELPTIVSSIEG